MRLLLLLPISLSLVACGGAGSPTGPSTPVPTPTPAPTPTPDATPSPGPSPTPEPSATPVVLRTATLQGANGHSCSGTAEIVERGGSHTLELRSDFRIDSGNNDVYLSRSPNSIDGGLNLGNMKSRTGAQSYAMPDSGSSYRYVILWCRPFRVPIGTGELR